MTKIESCDRCSRVGCEKAPVGRGTRCVRHLDYSECLARIDDVIADLDPKDSDTAQVTEDLRAARTPLDWYTALVDAAEHDRADGLLHGEAMLTPGTERAFVDGYLRTVRAPVVEYPTIGLEPEHRGWLARAVARIFR